MNTHSAAGTHPDIKASDGFDLEDSDDLFNVARQLIDGHHIGVLTTVDSHGAPHARYMATLAFDEFPRFLTLTAAGSCKTQHIRANPQVNWLFSNEDYSLVLNLKGRAAILTDTPSIKRAWKAVKDKSHTFFLTNMSGKPGIAVIETVVERIDYTSAQSGFRFSRAIETAHSVPPEKP